MMSVLYIAYMLQQVRTLSMLIEIDVLRKMMCEEVEL